MRRDLVDVLLVAERLIGSGYAIVCTPTQLAHVENTKFERTHTLMVSPSPTWFEASNASSRYYSITFDACDGFSTPVDGVK